MTHLQTTTALCRPVLQQPAHCQSSISSYTSTSTECEAKACGTSNQFHIEQTRGLGWL